MRAYLRQRERLLDDAAAHIQHMQKALTQMNLQIHHVVADITGVTGMRIIRGIVVICPRFSWTAICPTGGIHGSVQHEQDRQQRCG